MFPGSVGGADFSLPARAGGCEFGVWNEPRCGFDRFGDSFFLEDFFLQFFQ